MAWHNYLLGATVGLLIGGAIVRQVDKEAVAQYFQNPLELKCEQDKLLTETTKNGETVKRDASMRGLDGTVYMLKCDANGNPALQERGQ